MSVQLAQGTVETTMLNATFVRTSGEPDRIYVTRSDGTEVSWSFPTYGDGLPHDLVHWVVETCCGLRSGFWGRVDAGADPGAINAKANRAGGRGKYAGFGPQQAELFVAEALAGAGWWMEGVTDEEIQESVIAQCRELGIPAPDLPPARIERIRTILDALARRWRAARPRGSIRVVFRTDSPEESVSASEIHAAQS